MRHRLKHRHRQSGIGRVWTAEVLDVDRLGWTSAWPILEDSFWGSQEGTLSGEIHMFYEEWNILIGHPRRLTTLKTFEQALDGSALTTPLLVETRFLAVTPSRK